ncbi:efflux RND transporter periplasmic adaptor subunit [Piscibacillus halophilus]|uniref:RND family efflux transporter, MFP subunit n=1 Tax=Piscibacillus halophilus TaxID=571933 RepID=A0A1H9IQ29_9BACI|nr:efflux RND transporter periplasmic adaptor subunit [Piscibacillus halophilus]SEQ76666.1 RND family efflux transporter, MFP subunit [Piscibacillus halophilus]
MKRKLLILIVAMLTVVLAACNDEPEEEETETVATPVEVEEVVQSDFTETRTFTARTMPSDQMPVIAQAAGEVDELFVEQGDTVEEGDVLAEIVNPQYGRQELEAPMDGQIQELNMVEGRAVTNEEPAAVVVAIDPLNLNFNVPASEVNNFSEDDELEFTVSQLEKEGTATVTSVADSAGETGTFEIQAEIDNEDQEILAGVSAQVLLEKIVAENALTVPTEAVVERGEERVVFVAKDGKAIQVPVEVIGMQSQITAVRATEEDSLEEGDQVVVRGQLTLSDDQEISINEEGE